jgi:hypothetical protein
MFDSIPEPADAQTAPPPQTAARERMGLLRRFSEIGLRVAERIDRQSEAAAVLAESSLPSPEVQAAAFERLEKSARAFAQVARASTLAIALEDRIERGPPLEAPPFGPELVCTVPREAALTTRREEVEASVRKAVNLCAEANPRRDIDDLFRSLDGLLAREMAQVDAFLCRPSMGEGQGWGCAPEPRRQDAGEEPASPPDPRVSDGVGTPPSQPFPHRGGRASQSPPRRPPRRLDLRTPSASPPGPRGPPAIPRR